MMRLWAVLSTMGGRCQQICAMRQRAVLGTGGGVLADMCNETTSCCGQGGGVERDNELLLVRRRAVLAYMWNESTSCSRHRGRCASKYVQWDNDLFSAGGRCGTRQRATSRKKEGSSSIYLKWDNELSSAGGQGCYVFWFQISFSKFQKEG